MLFSNIDIIAKGDGFVKMFFKKNGKLGKKIYLRQVILFTAF